MSGTLRSLTGVCLALALALAIPVVANASVVKGEKGETFVDPLFAEEATCQT